MIFLWMSFPIKRSQKFPRNLPIRVKHVLSDAYNPRLYDKKRLILPHAIFIKISKVFQISTKPIKALPIYETLFDLGKVEIFPSQTSQYRKLRQTSIKSLDYQPLTSTRSDENLTVKVNRAF